MPTLSCELSIAEDLTLDARLPLAELETLAIFAEQVMTQLNLQAPLTMSLHITTDAHSQALNRDYRDVDAPTDILSFEADPLPPEIGEFEIPTLGDLILAYDYTLNQALHHNHAPLNEFKLLIVHGTLHLLGYTHDDAESQTEMWAEQAALLTHFSINITVPDYVHGRDDEDEA